MKPTKVVLAALLALGTFALPARSSAASCTIAYVFATGAVPTAAQFNANPNQFATCFSNIDNTNIGAAGLFASQIKADTSVHGTFGGTAGYMFAPTSAAIVPLKVNAFTGQTVDILDVQLNGTNEVWVDSAGVLHTLGVPQFAGVNVGGPLTGATTGSFSGVLTATGVNVGGALTGATTGAFAGGITATTGVFSSSVTALNTQSAANGGTLAYVPPVFSIAGTSLAATTHAVQGNVTASGATTTLTFSSSAAFANTAYSVSIFDATSGAIVTASPIVLTTNTLSFPSINTHVYNYLFVGP